MSVDSAYNLVSSSNVTSSTAYVDLDSMTSSYDIYYFSFQNVKVASEAYLDIVPKVSGSVVSGTNANIGGLRKLIRYYDKSFSTEQGVYATWELYYFSISLD